MSNISIKTAEEFKNFILDNPSGTCTITADIIQLNNWSSLYFSGVIDGNDKIIETDNVIFSNFTGTIKNAYIQSDITNTSDYTGALAKVLDGANVEGCRFFNYINGVGYTGGIAGEIKNSTISKCYIENDIECSNSWRHGGIAGSSTNSVYKDIILYGNISSSGTRCGGLVGEILGENEFYRIVNIQSLFTSTATRNSCFGFIQDISTLSCTNVLYDISVTGHIDEYGNVLPRSTADLLTLELLGINWKKDNGQYPILNIYDIGDIVYIEIGDISDGKYIGKNVIIKVSKNENINVTTNIPKSIKFIGSDYYNLTGTLNFNNNVIIESLRSSLQGPFKLELNKSYFTGNINHIELICKDSSIVGDVSDVSTGNITNSSIAGSILTSNINIVDSTIVGNVQCDSIKTSLVVGNVVSDLCESSTIDGTFTGTDIIDSIVTKLITADKITYCYSKVTMSGVTEDCFIVPYIKFKDAVNLDYTVVYDSRLVVSNEENLMAYKTSIQMKESNKDIEEIVYNGKNVIIVSDLNKETFISERYDGEFIPITLNFTKNFSLYNQKTKVSTNEYTYDKIENPQIEFNENFIPSSEIVVQNIIAEQFQMESVGENLKVENISNVETTVYSESYYISGCYSYKHSLNDDKHIWLIDNQYNLILQNYTTNTQVFKYPLFCVDQGIGIITRENFVKANKYNNELYYYEELGTDKTFIGFDDNIFKTFNFELDDTTNKEYIAMLEYKDILYIAIKDRMLLLPVRGFIKTYINNYTTIPIDNITPLDMTVTENGDILVLNSDDKIIKLKLKYDYAMIKYINEQESVFILREDYNEVTKVEE